MRVKTILYSAHFVRSLKSLGPDFVDSVRTFERIFQVDCFDKRLKTHKLKGKMKGYWSCSLTPKYRILFEMKEEGTVAFIDVGDHSIYR